MNKFDHHGELLRTRLIEIFVENHGSCQNLAHTKLERTGKGSMNFVTVFSKPKSSDPSKKILLKLSETVTCSENYTPEIQRHSRLCD